MVGEANRFVSFWRWRFSPAWRAFAAGVVRPKPKTPVVRRQNIRWIFRLAGRGNDVHVRGMTLAKMRHALARLASVGLLLGGGVSAEEAVVVPKAFVDGTGPGWRALAGTDFVNVNCASNTWSWEGDGVHCTGEPVGVIRSRQFVTNLEMVVEWRHLRSSGNSGVFLWATDRSIQELEAGKGRLPEGIEVQILDHGYAERYERQSGKKADWFTTHGDVFPTGRAEMKPFPPTSPNGQRGFPRKHLSRGAGEWNHYYIRAINGEVRLWVNGEEVSGGTGCKPAFGYLCLESEGSPVEFRNVRLRELP